MLTGGQYTKRKEPRRARGGAILGAAPAGRVYYKDEAGRRAAAKSHDQGRGAADRGQYREAAGATAQSLSDTMFPDRSFLITIWFSHAVIRGSGIAALMTVLRQNLFRLWLLISILWLVASAWIITREWSGDSVSSREYLLFNEPVSWGEQHPECRNRFGFWPDGTRMKASEIDDAVYYILAKQRTLTPEEVARSKWARDVGAKIAACEAARWMPIVNPAPLQTDCRTTTMSSLIVPLGSYRRNSAAARQQVSRCRQESTPKPTTGTTTPPSSSCERGFARSSSSGR